MQNALTAFIGALRAWAWLILLLAGCTTATPSASPTLPASGPTPTSTSLQPTPSLPIAIPTATAAAPGFAWQRLASIETTRDLAGIAASSAGYVVIERTRTAWFSTDGHIWTKATLPFKMSTSGKVTLDATVNAIVGGPDGFMAVGSYDDVPCPGTADGGPPPCAVGPISWVSRDGLTWRSSLPRPIPEDGSELAPYSVFASAWLAGGGWDAAVEVRDSVAYHGNILLHSADGLAWTRSTALPLPEGVSANRVYAHGGVAAASGRRLVWQDRNEEASEISLATSLDGKAWTGIGGPAGTGKFVLVGVGPAGEADNPWLLVGGMQMDGPPTCIAWLSSDLATWRSGTLTAARGDCTHIYSLERGADGYIALGTYGDVDGNMVPTTWLSSDGTAWTEESAPSSPADGPLFLVSGPAGLLGVGSTDDVSAVWLGMRPGS